MIAETEMSCEKIVKTCSRKERHRKVPYTVYAIYLSGGKRNMVTYFKLASIKYLCHEVNFRGYFD